MSLVAKVFFRIWERFYPFPLSCVGIELFSRTVSRKVSSPLQSLTSVFGMGTGGPSAFVTPTWAVRQCSAIHIVELRALLRKAYCLHYSHIQESLILENWTTLYLYLVSSLVKRYVTASFDLLHVLHRKEVIQPHLPIRLPCYDLTPIIEPTFDGCLLAVSPPASGVFSFHGLTGGVYKARERIHRDMLIRDY